ncbi:hypothetical protein ILUMI_11164 [Ignelater luminosus]|uniref:Ig-like domain-containing protein n=1 Tax=Ignelater luminosus TaxID=2038154 RepID=A0A8K0CWS0_IGNLU|nr:hypothetical protein ILUMI_11164 [Ignelater luminosus]
MFPGTIIELQELIELQKLVKLQELRVVGLQEKNSALKNIDFVLYRWKKNGKPFDWFQYDDHITQTPGSGTLKFSDFFDSDAGSYQCFAENEMGTATSNKVIVHLAHLNNFKMAPPLTLNGTEGQPFQLKCDPPSGIPKPKVVWLMQYNESKMEVINTPRITFDPEGTLWFSYLKQEDVTVDFVYACTADSRVAHEYKIGNKLHLNVLESDVNEFEPSLQYVTTSTTGVQHGRNASGRVMSLSHKKELGEAIVAKLCRLWKLNRTFGSYSPIRSLADRSVGGEKVSSILDTLSWGW